MGLAAGDRLGRYEILAPLGAGGMGEVYRAHDERLDRDVAIKVLPEAVAQDPDRLARFEREARAAAALDHPNILAVHDVGSHDGAPYIVTELLEGETLRERIKRADLTLAKAVEYSIQAAAGLDAAHSQGIIHRDLKPSNLFVTKDGRVKILDFGLAKLTSTEPAAAADGSLTGSLPTEPGVALGTVGYMAPEQVRGRAADPRSDIFAIGVMLYEMISGARPFEGTTAADTLAKIIHEDPSPLRPSTPQPLRRIVKRCLEKRPDDRFQSVHDLALALEAVSAAPARRRWPTAAAALAVVAVLALAVGLGPRVLQRLRGPAVRQPLRSIAILPLENLTGDPEQAYFVDGLHAELIATFAQLSGFDRVTARTSVMGFRDAGTPIREIGRQLGVAAVLEGSVRLSGGTMRATVQLIDARTEANLWAHSFERHLTDVLVLQSDVARAVADEVRVTLTPGERERLARARTVDADAHALYLRAYGLLWLPGSEHKVLRAIGLLEEAIERDPEYAPAHAGLSIAFRNLSRYRPPAETMPRALATALRAVELDDDLPLAHAVLARVRYLWEWDWAAAEAEFRRALELGPNDDYAARSYGQFLVAVGRFDQAIAVAERMMNLDPLNIEAPSQIGWVYWHARRHDDGIASLLSVVELHPNDYSAHLFLAWNYSAKGLLDEAIAELERARALHPSPRYDPFFLMIAVWTYRAAEMPHESAEALDRLLEIGEQGYLSPAILAYAYTGIGDVERAIELWQRAFEVHDLEVAFINSNPVLDPLRSDPRFQDIVRRMNFPES